MTIEEIHAPESFDGSEGLLAIVIRADLSPLIGTFFLTDPVNSQQVALIGRNAGERIQPHIHRKIERKVTITQEVLVVRRGRMRVTIYTSDRQLVQACELTTGDTIALLAGGHGFEFLEPTELLEVKQGPHISGMDKMPIMEEGRAAV